MFVLGIVGSIAGGKSTVCKQLHKLGGVWINADLIARDALNLSPVRQSLVAQFGAEILDSDGHISRSALGALVFGDDRESHDRLEQLERIVHPVVRRLIEERLQHHAACGTEVVLLDIPLMFQSGWDRSCDQVWCIDAKPEIRQVRAAGRGWDENELRRREQHQTSIGEKRRLSNLVIENNGSLAELSHSLDLLWQDLRDTLELDPQSDSHCG